jgi:hypothetical protein
MRVAVVPVVVTGAVVRLAASILPAGSAAVNTAENPATVSNTQPSPDRTTTCSGVTAMVWPPVTELVIGYVAILAFADCGGVCGYRSGGGVDVRVNVRGVAGVVLAGPTESFQSDGLVLVNGIGGIGDVGMNELDSHSQPLGRTQTVAKRMRQVPLKVRGVERGHVADADSEPNGRRCSSRQDDAARKAGRADLRSLQRNVTVAR